jgi:poly(A) polymerase
MDFSKHLMQTYPLQLVSSVADEMKLETYVVGGYVRDLVLNRGSKDIDFVCVGSGVTLAEKVMEKAGKVDGYSVYKNFGTAMIRIDGWELEFVGARKESYREDSRKPTVEEGSLQDDQNRRDFTINALAIGLNKSNFGILVDPFGGVQHIKERILKTPLAPEITFSDDPLRMMRGIRFASQLNFDIEPDTFEAISKNKDRLNIVSMERISEELNKIILSPKPSYGFKLLYQTGILEKILPELTDLKGVEIIDGKGHKDNFYHTLQVLDNICEFTDDLWLRWAAILHDIAKKQTKKFVPGEGWTFHGHEELGARKVPKIFARLKLPLNEKMRFTQKMVRMHLRPIALAKEGVGDSALRRLLFDTGDDLESLLILCRADITSKDPNKVKKYLGNFDHLVNKLTDVEERDKVRNFQPSVTGEIIMKSLSLPPGKEVGYIKTQLREAILEGKVSNEYEESYDYMLKIAKEMNLKP